MTSKLVVNTIEADTGISSVSFASSISMSSTSKFHFSSAGIDIGADTNINRPSAGVLGFNINGSQKVVITSNGRLGIGTNNPQQMIEVQDRSGGTLIGLSVGTQYGNASFGGYNNYPAIMNNASQPLIYCDTNNDRTVFFGDTVGFGTTCAFRVNGAERLRITSAGYLKLGSTDGGAWHTIRLNTTTNNAIKDVLNIHSSVDGATAAAGFGVRLNFFGEQLNGNEYIYGSIAGLLSSSGSGYGDLAFYTNNNGTNTERLRIGSDGLLTATGNADFNVAGGELDIYSTGSGNQHSLRLLNSDASAGNKIGIYFGPANNVAGAYISGVAESDFTSAANRDAGLEFGTRLNATFLTPLKISAAGYVQTNNNPSFRAGLNSNTSFTSSTDIIFNDTSSTWHYNRGGHYNTGNGRFTAPVTGVYQFNACVIWYGAPNNTFMGDAFHYYVNGGLASYSGRRGYYNTGTTGNSLYYTDHMSVNLYLNATDYVHIRQSSPVVTVHGNTYYTWFAGSYLG